MPTTANDAEKLQTSPTKNAKNLRNFMPQNLLRSFICYCLLTDKSLRLQIKTRPANIVPEYPTGKKQKSTVAEFLPARRYAWRDLCESDVSVCLSVCPPVTRQYCIKTKRASVMISSPSDSPMISLSAWQGVTRPKIRKGSPPARAIYETGVGSNWRFLRFFDL